MKKIFFFAVAIAMIGLASCGSRNQAPSNDSVVVDSNSADTTGYIVDELDSINNSQK